MATKTDNARAGIEKLKTDIRNVEDCSTSTVTRLKFFLENRSDGIEEKENATVKASQARAAKAPARRKGASTTITTSRATTKQSSNNLTPRDRYILATEVANFALKSLSDALRVTPPPQSSRSSSKSKPQSEEDASASAKRQQPPAKRSTQTTRHLQELPTEQATNGLKKYSERGSGQHTSPAGPDAGLVATVECARAAFAYLRTAEAVKIAGNDSPTLQLENGMLALVGKLVAHGLDNLAIKELRILKRRLDMFLGTVEKQKSAGRQTKSKLTNDAEAIPEERVSIGQMIDFGEIDQNNAALPIVINYQTYALRLIARSRRPRLIEEAWTSLKLSNPGSPANLSWHAAQASKDAKAIRQLESLAQIFLSMCPSISSSGDEAAEDANLYPSPDVVLSLQHLAFKTRQRWWALASHQGNEERELLEPFAKCLIAFSRRSKLAASKNYRLANLLYTDLVPVNDQSSSKQSPSFASASKVLGNLAQAAGSSTDALRWLGTSAPPTTSKETVARITIRHVRAASLSIDAALKGANGDGVEEPIDIALGALSSCYEGSSSDLQALFIEAQSFRRVVSRGLAKSSQSEPGNTYSPLSNTLALQVINATVHFSSRFLSAPKVNKALAGDQSRQNERLDIMSKHIKSIVDSICVGSKVPVHQDSDAHFAEFESLVNDCICILQHFGDGPGRIAFPDDLQCPFVKLSNAYWAVHLQIKLSDGMGTSAIRAMQHSVAVLQDRPTTERRAGLINMKLERLGDALDASGRAEDACANFLRCVEELVESGMLKEAARLAYKHPIHVAFEDDETTSPLGRMFKTHHRAALKAGVKDVAFFDSAELPAAERGVSLEWQLSLYLRTLSKNRTWDAAFNSFVSTICERLLIVYDTERFPIRHRRARLMIFQLLQEHPNVLSPHILSSAQALDSTVADALGEDVDLMRYGAHLDALLCLKQSLLDPSPQKDDLEQCTKMWHNLIDSATSWQDVIHKVDDPEHWLQALETMSHYLLAKGEEYFCISVLQLLVKVLELKKDVDATRQVSALCALATLLLRLGYSGKAGLTFAQAETLAATTQATAEAKIRWHIAYAEYLLTIGNIDKCEQILSTAEEIARGDQDFMSLIKPSTTLSGRLRFNRLLADACHVHSLHAARSGYLKDAARYAKQCVTLNRRIWSALENKSATRQPEVDHAEKGKFDPVSSIRTDAGTPIVISNTHESLDGPEFWSLVPCLFRGLLQQSLVYAHQGLLQEAVYFAEQAEKVSAATKSRSFATEIASLRAQYWAQSGRTDNARAALDSIEVSLPYKHSSLACYYSSTAWVAHMENRFDDEIEAYASLDRLVEDLVAPSFLHSLGINQSNIDELAEKFSAVSLNKAEAPQSQPQRATRGRKLGLKPTVKTTAKDTSKTTTKITTKAPAKTASKARSQSTRRPKEAAPSEEGCIANECSPLQQLRAEIVRRKALAEIVRNNTTQALKLVELAKSLENETSRSVLNLWVHFKALMSQGMEELSRDVTLNTLPESTIAFPAIGTKGSKSSTSLTERRNKVPPVSKRGRARASAKDHFVTVLQEARDHLLESHTLCAQAGSTFQFQQTSLALGQITVLLSAVSGGDACSSLHPGYAAYMSEIPKCNSLQHSQQTIELEQESMSREECLKWPDLEQHRRFALASTADFQKEYIDIIPKSWIAISLALNENQDELYITRYESGHMPFVLRLPLARHASRDMDEEEFSYQDGKQELDEIIELSDFSTRSAKDMTSKEARLQWWAEREALDNKLRELLLNIENIWLGGFRGIFSQHLRRSALLEDFRKSFDAILGRNLPSRQGKGCKADTALDIGVLELFVGLGDANDEELDLDEALTDLIYFVVDILQFSGERNAYDEIDFDAIVIETLDALRAYHSTHQKILHDDREASKHTILILDNSLHGFPWESLPCLQPLSISRLPSLAALRERIISLRPPRLTEDGHEGHYISAEIGGTSVLNPSGDLSHTYKTLKPRLDDMQGTWTHIANRSPSEKEFEKALKEDELVLYFGHGSGAQYVRSKSVRRLYPGQNAESPGCATTFLFGCSSVHLSENGIYEPSGMLASYLTAGAPAVVGMLWDVTDKDCDRFAIRAGELWGLWPERTEEAEASKSGKKAKGKGKVAQLVADVESARGGDGKKAKTMRGQIGDEGRGRAVDQRDNGNMGLGLDEAVRGARDACVLRYLNGAAAVVYGIPVYLE